MCNTKDCVRMLCVKKIYNCHAIFSRCKQATALIYCSNLLASIPITKCMLRDNVMKSLVLDLVLLVV